jgi:protein TonB
MKRTSRFTILHGLAISLALHGALCAPFVVHSLDSPPDDDPPPLVIELQGAVADSQTEQKELQQIKGEAKQEEAETPKAAEAPPPPPIDEPPPKDIVDHETELAVPPPQPAPQPTTSAETHAKSGSAGARNVTGTEVQQTAQIIKTDPQEIERLREYVKRMTKKVQANLAYPDGAQESDMHGTAMVAFIIQANGQIRADSLKIVESSGQPRLDASALKTIRASAPFDPPPRELPIAIGVTYGRKR